MTKQEIIERDLPCRLTEAELLKKGDRLAAIELEIAELKDKRAGVSAEIKDLADERADLADAVDRKLEKRKVPCEWRKDFEAQRVVLVRLDTAEVVDERPLTADDRQVSLLTDGSDDDPPPRATKPESVKAKVTRHAH